MESPKPSATTIPMTALVVCVVPASHSLAAHSTRMNVPMTMDDTIANTAARFSTKPTSMSRRLSAAYVRPAERETWTGC